MNGLYSFERICNFIDVIQPCMDDYMFVYDLDDDVYHISSSVCEQFHIETNHFHNVIGAHKEFVYPDDYQLLINDLNKIKKDHQYYHNLQYRWISKMGEPLWVNCRGKAIVAENGNTLMIGCVIDIGSSQKADNVSGLLSMTTLNNLFSSLDFTPKNGYLLRIGIDDFKSINERLGTDYGDLLIKKTAESIKECLLPHQLVYRLIGDEFLVIELNVSKPEQALEQYKEIRSKIDSFVESNHYETVLTISGGILPFSAQAAYSFTDFMKYSEFSLNEAKRNGKNQSYIFAKEDYDSFIRRKNISSILRQSINHGYEGFTVYIQPLYDTQSKKIIGGESLLRFYSPELGMISPAEFVPILEETGLIIPVGKWVLHQSLYLCQEISKLFPGFRIAINVSYIQILKSNIISEILYAVTQYDIDPATQVTIELTESGEIASDILVEKMWEKLKAKGIRLALDDFGTGYANFQYFDNIQPHIIKIDRSLTLKALDNEYFFHMLSLISNMVHKLDILFCIEGIETEKELARVLALKPDLIQGYYFGKPYPYEEFIHKYITPALDEQKSC